MFFHFEASLISPNVLSHCPSEAQHDLQTTTYASTVRTNINFPSEADHERLPPRQPETVKQNRNGIIPVRTHEHRERECPPVQATEKKKPVQHDENFQFSAKPIKAAESKKQISEEAKDTIQMLEWTKNLVLQNTAKAIEAEKETRAASVFSVLLKKWRSDSALRSLRSFDELDVEEGIQKAKIDNTCKRSTMQWSFPQETPFCMERTKAFLSIRNAQNRQGLISLL